MPTSETRVLSESHTWPETVRTITVSATVSVVDVQLGVLDALSSARVQAIAERVTRSGTH